MSDDFTDSFREAKSSNTQLVEAPCQRDNVTTFAQSVATGLSDDPKWLHCRFLYDAEGSRLFEAITEQPEYYPTRTEAVILARHAAEIRELTGPVTLVELGSGYSVKTEHLLSAYAQNGTEVDYVPVDVSINALQEASRSIADSFPAVNFTGIRGTYASAFPVFHELSPQLVIFLGSTLGNFNDLEFDAFWHSISEHLPRGDKFLLGVDLVKDAAILDAAYNDAAGVTARFTNNYFVRMNKELGSDVDIDHVQHVANWNPDREQIEIFARFETTQRIRVEPLDRVFEIAAGEQILIEISRKFRLPKLTADLERFGLHVRETFTDDNEWFGLLLLQRT